MLDIIATVLEVNDVCFIRPKSGKRFGEDIGRFRSGNTISNNQPICPILLLNIKNGAEGLTLVEASHVFMVESILNNGLDAQAINRIHRITHVLKTFIHRYVVAGTIEEKIDAIRMERQETNFEDDLQEQRNTQLTGEDSMEDLMCPISAGCLDIYVISFQVSRASNMALGLELYSNHSHCQTHCNAHSYCLSLEFKGVSQQSKHQLRCICGHATSL